MNNMILNALSGIASKAIGGNNSIVNEALQVYNSLNGKSNYMEALEAMSKNNPRIAEALEVVKQEGGDPAKAFYNLASKSGVDAKTILSMIKK